MRRVTIAALISALINMIPEISSANDSGSPSPDVRYQVVGVTAGDRLNVREDPNSSAKVVGSLAPGQSRIVVTGRYQVLDRKVKGGAKWWEVLIHVAPPKTGWVHSRFLKQEPPNSTFEGSEAGFALKCIGTEPFWDLDVDIGSAEMEESGEGRRQLRASPWIMAQGLRDQFAVQLSNKDGSEFGWVAIAGAERRCTDNMSDNVYPLTATVIRREGSVLGGCCYRGGEKSSPVRR